MRCGLMLGISVLATLIAEGTSHCTDARSLAEVRQNGILRLCANPSALPYSNLTDGGGLAGFEVELAEVLAHEMGLELGVAWVRNAGEIESAADEGVGHNPRWGSHQVGRRCGGLSSWP
jgi:ABC-type amino acid transport substrate-binding protein